MAKLDDIVTYSNDLLAHYKIKDYCPNGLQVGGKQDIKKIISGVSASQELLDAAIGMQADLILVHHGFFWQREDPCLTGIKYKRISTLIKNNVGLLAYHLPLDADDKLGNNVQLANELGIKVDSIHQVDGGAPILFSGHLPQPVSVADWCLELEKKLNRAPLAVGNLEQNIQTIAWCTGGAQDFIEDAADLGVDAYLSGEISERTTHIARETGLTYISAGHHATERYGVQALGAALAEKFALQHSFIDIDNPV